MEQKKSAKQKEQDQDKIHILKQRVTALETDKTELLTKVGSVDTTDQSLQTDLTSEQITNLINQ
jgi:hypothetical protein